MNKETKLQRRIMLALSSAGCIVFRNETAGAYVGKVIHKAGQQVTLAGATYLPVGLCKGSSDIIGIAPDGRFLAVEVKTDTGRATKEQHAFIRVVNHAGGIAGIVRSEQDALDLIKQEGSNDQAN